VTAAGFIAKLQLAEPLAMADELGVVTASREFDAGGGCIWRTINGVHVCVTESVPAYFGTAEEAISEIKQKGITHRVLLTTSRHVAEAKARRAAMGTLSAKPIVAEVRVPTAEVQGLRPGAAIDKKFSYARESVPKDWIVDGHQLGAAGAFKEGDTYFIPIIAANPSKQHVSLYAARDFMDLKRRLEALDAKGVEAMRAVMTEMRDFLVGKVRTGDLSKIVRTLGFSGRVKADLRRAVRELLQRAWDAGTKDVRREVRAGKAEVRKHADPEPFTPRAAMKWLDDKAFWVSGVSSDRAIADAKAVILNGLKTGKSNQEMMDAVRDVFVQYLGEPGVIRDGEQLKPYRLETIVRTNVTDAYNHGRLTEMLSPEYSDAIAAVRYSAILDERTTEVCRYLNGFLFKPGSADLVDLTPPNHFNCRSIIVPVVYGEPMNENDFIGPMQVGFAKGLADQKFLTEARGAWKAYSERQEDA